MTLYRPHRRLLIDAMAEVCEFETLAGLVAILRGERDGWPDQDEVTEAAVKLEAYGFDKRIEWETWIVTVNGHVVGFTNGNPSAEDAPCATITP